MSKLRTLVLAGIFSLAPAALLAACGDDATPDTPGPASQSGTGASGGSTNECGESNVCLLNNCSDDCHCAGADCGNRNFCDLANNTCLACDGSHSCPDGLECTEYGLCVPPGTTCPTDAMGNPTVDCGANSDCAACSPQHQVCDTNTSKCVACTPTNTQHCQQSDICINGQCSPKCPTSCASDNDCGECGGPGNEAHACFQHKCSQCSDTFGCPADQECLQGKCVPPCGIPGPVSGQCVVNEDCAFCGVENPDSPNPNPWQCKTPVNSDHGTCFPPADGCEDLGPGSAVLPEPYNDFTEACSSDANCNDIGIQFDVGELIIDLVGDDEIAGININSATVTYPMPICASVEILNDIDCGICVPCEQDSDCEPIAIDPLLPQIFADDPLAIIAGAVLFDLLFGKNDDHELNFFCQPVAFGYGACVPCGNPLQPCGDPDIGDGTGDCDHTVAETGGPLKKSCSSCAETVCNEDAFCCTDSWDSLCVDEAAELCGGCEHDTCTPGEALSASCSPCATSVCDLDPYCCQTAWDQTCVDEAEADSECPATCTGCSHDECSIGGPLVDDCSACVTSVCGADAFCCETEWDQQCVNEADADSACPVCN